ncbi:MAG: response regulator [Sulfurimonas sp.]|nr:response regulator [Sulfurimonas sp.]
MTKFKEYTILIVEDEFIAMEYLSQILLSFRAKDIYKAKNADEALEIVRANSIDLAFMDINIEGSIDGIECASLLNRDYFVPIIFTSAYGDTNTLNEAKDENVFGYLIKPFQPNDVEASLLIAISIINRIKKFSLSEKQNIMQVVDLSKDYLYHIDSKTLTLYNNPIDLTKKELEFLDILCSNLNQNVSYNHLKESIWPQKEISDSTVRDVVSRLKKKIPHIYIENISNYGYILKGPI